MEFPMFCSRISFLIFLIVLSLPSKFIQSPRDFGSLNLLQATKTASLDFGRIYFNSPSVVLRPQSLKKISAISALCLVLISGTVAARGAWHFPEGQAQALNGIVVEMDLLPSSFKIYRGADGESSPYVAVSGGTFLDRLV